MSVSRTVPERPAPATNGTSAERPVPRRRTLWTASQIVLVRLRFLLLILAVVLLVGYWDTVRNYWDKLTRTHAPNYGAVSSDSEYWCPMCPGVVSDWPGKCPVCNMSLVRRKKGEMVPLPDGVVARVQFSPYRVLLAGIRTTPAEYRSLTQELVLLGTVEPRTPGSPAGTARVAARVPERDVALVVPGRTVVVSSAALPDTSFHGTVCQLSPELTRQTHQRLAQLDIEDPRGDLLPGMRVTVRLRVPVGELPWFARAWTAEWSQRTLLDVLACTVGRPAGPIPAAGLEPLTLMACQQVLHRHGLVLAVPDSAVVDTGVRAVVFVESMPGVFDAREVTLGRRCGEYYPVLRGLTGGARTVTAGAFALDAETRLNPALAASYFGSGRSASSAPPEAPHHEPDVPTPPSSAGEENTPERQKACIVCDGPLGDEPVRIVLGDKVVFICCESCEPQLRQSPQKYLRKLRAK